MGIISNLADYECRNVTVPSQHKLCVGIAQTIMYWRIFTLVIIIIVIIIFYTYAKKGNNHINNNNNNNK